MAEAFCVDVQGGPKVGNTSTIVNFSIWDFTYLRCYQRRRRLELVIADHGVHIEHLD